MPKVKTNKSAKKRFKITGSGKILRHQHAHAHLLSKKSSARKRRLNEDREVVGKDANKVLRLLGKK
ncbi:MAG: 50S ribosomal protein L35 [Acidimicrobiia bacterium]